MPAMDDTMTGATIGSPSEEGAATPFVAQRACTRCDGHQHLVGEFEGLGKYRCDSCEMVVGFDVHSEPAEFLLHRGLPSRYTKDVFGDILTGPEERIPAAT